MRRPRTDLIVAASVVAALLLPAAAARGQEEADPFDPAYQGKTAAPKPTEDAETQPTKPPSPKAEKIGQMVEYYLKMYAEHLERSDWIARSMAVISLGRIDDARVTDKLLSVAWQDRRTLVRVFAWEALHARSSSLSAEQRQRWMKRGWSLARRGAFRGELRVGLLGLMRSAEPTPAARKALMKIFNNTNLLDPGDRPTLAAMRQVVAAWRDPETIMALIKAMGDLNNAYRAEYVLGGLNSGVPYAVTLSDQGSRPMWSRTQHSWVEWYRSAKPAPAPAEELKPYIGLSRLLPLAEKITDPRDPKWRKDLELGRLYLDQLDVTFAVDSTGSMTEVVGWIKRDVSKMMRAFGMISREPRIGIVFYRDHGDEYVVQVHPLTDRGNVLAKAISGAAAKGGGDVPEAVYDALRAAVKQQRWSRSDRARKVVVLVGDAAPHEDTMEQIEKLLTGSTGKGFRFHCVKAHTRYGSSDLSSFDRIAEWGKGRAIAASFPAGRGWGWETGGDDDPYRLIVREVLKSALTGAYHDRVRPFVDVLLEYLELPVPEKRRAFGPKPPPRPRQPGPGPGPRRPPQRPPKPYDPQER